MPSGHYMLGEGMPNAKGTIVTNGKKPLTMLLP
jgi:hypothetical protein